MEKMTRLEYRVEFTTPAFIGGAEQKAQWRTPPFKALLRQWWRIANAAHFGYDYSKLREAEGALFGNAWLNGPNSHGKRDAHRKSEVRLRLEPEWTDGSLDPSRWPSGFGTVATTAGGKGSSADVYLGYGPVFPNKRSAIDVKQSAILVVIGRESDRHAIVGALTLAAWFGTLGSRSRNAWGSMHLEPQQGAPELPSLSAASPVLIETLRSVDHCLASKPPCDWPHAIGADTGRRPLIWETEEFDDWRRAIHRLAAVRVAVRSAAKKYRNGHAGGIHFLGYPAGKDWVLNGAKTARLASQLRFKIVQTGSGKVRGRIFHVPCAMPQAFLMQLSTPAEKEWLRSSAHALQTWSAVHDVLRADSGLTQLGAAP